MLPFDASEQIAAKFGRSMDELFVNGSFGEGIQFLAEFLAMGFQEDHKIADRQLQLYRGKEEIERKLSTLAGDELSRARLRKMLKEVESAIHQPLDSFTPEHAQAYYVGRMELLMQLIADLGLLAEMMEHPSRFVSEDGTIHEH